jgi:hypothetical protein
VVASAITTDESQTLFDSADKNSGGRNSQEDDTLYGWWSERDYHYH